MKNRDGSDYLPHTPKNPDLPGWYFHSLDGVHTWDIDGAEMLVWGNYCNVLGGPVPVNIYYSTDGGQTVKIAYSFGRNPNFQEKGADPASFLGDPGNPVICRHIHAVAYNPAERAFYACTGDIDRGHGNECHWLRGTYDAKADHWEWQRPHLGELELALQIRRHQLRRWPALLGRGRERPQATGTKNTTAAFSAARRLSSPIPPSTRCSSTPSSRWPT